MKRRSIAKTKGVIFIRSIPVVFDFDGVMTNNQVLVFGDGKEAAR